MLRRIATELKHHAPFTATGAATGIIIMLIIVFNNVLPQVSQNSYTIFYILHPTHVLLSALVTTAMYRRNTQGGFLWTVVIGYLGSVGIATLSDSIIPFVGELLLDLPNAGMHIGFIEKWWLVNPMAVAGIIIGFLWTRTHIPHAGHVFVSTWASLFHIMMAMSGVLNVFSYLVVFIFLFLAVWVPCCFSDIVFPLLFVKDVSSKSNS